MHVKTLLAAFAAIPLAHAAVWNITVGQGGLTFTPNQATPAVGDTLHFIINPGHSVTQSTFAAPCTAMSGGPDSGVLTAAGTFEIPVTSTDPIWVYCKAGAHCKNGMVFAANPSSTQTFDAFQAAAEGKSSTGSNSSAAPSSSATGSASTGSSGNGASALESKGWMVGVAAFLGAAAMV